MKPSIKFVANPLVVRTLYDPAPSKPQEQDMTDNVKPFPPTRTGRYSAARFNARKHALLSSFPFLPFEDPKAHRTLLDDLVTEHQPHGRTEVHFVEDLAWVMLRIRRVRMAERGAYACALERVVANTPGLDDEAKAALLRTACATDEQAAIDQAELAKTRQSITNAVGLLDEGSPDAYRRALEVVTPEITSEWLKDNNSPATGISERIRKQYLPAVNNFKLFLTLNMQRKLDDRQDTLDNRSRIRDAAFGDPDYISALQPIARYEAHLDRKAERLLTMLFRLQELRGARTLIDPINLPD
jgi:hypothetical protein